MIPSKKQLLTVLLIVSGLVASNSIRAQSVEETTVTPTFSPAAVDIGETSTFQLIIDNPRGEAATNIQFSIPLPDGLEFADVPNASSTCNYNGATPVVDISDGENLVFSGGATEGGNMTCTVQVDVRAIHAGALIMTLSQNGASETSAQEGTLLFPSDGDKSVSLTSSSSDFTGSLSTIGSVRWGEGGIQLALSFSNPNPIALTNLSFSELPSQWIRFIAGNEVASDTCGGTAVFTAGEAAIDLFGETTMLSYSGGTLPAKVQQSGTCEIVFNVEVNYSPADGHFVSANNQELFLLEAGSVSVDNAFNNATGTFPTNSASLRAGTRVTGGLQFETNTAIPNTSTAVVQLSSLAEPFPWVVRLLNANTTEYSNVNLSYTLPDQELTLLNGTHDFCGGTVTISNNDTITIANATIPAATNLDAVCLLTLNDAATTSEFKNFGGITRNFPVTELVPGVGIERGGKGLNVEPDPETFQEPQLKVDIDLVTALGSEDSTNGNPLAVIGDEFDIIYTLTNTSDASTGNDLTNLSITDELPGSSGSDPVGILLTDDYETTCAGTTAFSKISTEPTGVWRMTGIEIPKASSCTIIIRAVSSMNWRINKEFRTLVAANFILNDKVDVNDASEEGITYQLNGSGADIAYAATADIKQDLALSRTLALAVSNDDTYPSQGPDKNYSRPGGVVRWGFRVSNLSEVGHTYYDLRAQADLMDGMAIADNPDATTDCGTGTVNAVAGGTHVELTGGQLAGRAGSDTESCYFFVNLVASTTVGVHYPSISFHDAQAVDFIERSLSARATHLPDEIAPASLLTTTYRFGGSVNGSNNFIRYNLNVVNADIAVSSAFNPASVPPATPSTLSVSINNNNNHPLTNVGFTIDLSTTSLKVAGNPNARFVFGNQANDICTDAVITIAPDNLSFSLSGATIGTSDTCKLEIDLFSQVGVSQSLSINAGAITSDQGDSNVSTTASIGVASALGLNVFFDPPVLGPNEEGYVVANLVNGTSSSIDLDENFNVVINQPAVVDSGRSLVAQCNAGTLGNVVVDTASANHNFTLETPTTFLSGDLCEIRVPVLLPEDGSGTISVAVGALKAGGLENNQVVNGEFFVAQKPDLSAAVSPSFVNIGRDTTLTYTLSNPEVAADLPDGMTGVNFDVTVPAGLAVASPLAVGGTCSNVLTDAVAGGGSFSIQSATIPPAVNASTPGTCTITIDLEGKAVGTHSLQTSTVNTDQAVTPTDTPPDDVTVEVFTTFISGVVYEDVNYGGGDGRDLSSSGGTGLNGVTVELYDAAGVFVESTTTASVDGMDGFYRIEIASDADYYVRVVNDTVSSGRSGSDGSEIGVQTFRAEESNGTVTREAVTQEVGGRFPALADTGAAAIGATFDTAAFTVSAAAGSAVLGEPLQSVSLVKVAQDNITGVDFGFNFSTIVNTNVSGYGSLHQFMLNANLLDSTGMNQALPAAIAGDYTTNDNVSVFMIPSAGSHASGASANALDGEGIARINMGADVLPRILVSNLAIDGRTQSENIGGNSDTVANSVSTVGVDAVSFRTLERPEIAINWSGGAGAYAFNYNGGGNALSRLAFRGMELTGHIFDDSQHEGYLGEQEDSNTVNGLAIEYNVFGLDAGTLAVQSGSNHAPSNGHSIVFGSKVLNATISHNLFGGGSVGTHIFANADNIENITITQNGFSGRVNGMGPFGNAANPANWVIRENHFSGMGGTAIVYGQNGASAYATYTIENNTIENNSDTGIRVNSFNFGNTNAVINKNIIRNNTGAGLSTNLGSESHGTRLFLSRNSFYGNGTLGIDLGNNGVTLNDAGDTDEGANRLLNFPMARATLSGNSLIMHGCAPANAVVELFEADISPTSGLSAASNVVAPATQEYGEGHVFLASFTMPGSGTACSLPVDVDGNDSTGLIAFSQTYDISADLPAGASLVVDDLLTLTATVSGSGTSEFSPVARILQADYGDAPATYGSASHDRSQPLLIGATAPDGENSDAFGNALGDDSAGSDDEDDLTFPELDDADTSYSLEVQATNQTSATAYLVGWIDLNGDGSFGNDEAATVAVPAGSNGSTVTLNWNSLPGITAGDSYVRLRLTTDTRVASGTAASSVATGLALDGEVEDHPLTIEVGGFDVSGTVFEDRNVNGNPDNGEPGIQQVTVVLHDTVNGTCSSTRTGADGSYRFSRVLPGSYTLYEAASETVPAPSSCPPAPQDPNNYLSTTADNSRSVTVSMAAVTGQDFADVQQPVLLDEHVSGVTPGSGVAYPHRFRTPTAGSVTFTLSDTADPADLAWGESLYQDNNCDGGLDSGDTAWPAGSVSVNAGDSLCLLAGAFAPANAAAGAVHVLNLHSDFSYGDGSSGLPNHTVMRSNISTSLGSTTSQSQQGVGSLELIMSAYNVTRSINGEQALPGETLRYTIGYANVGNGPLNTLVIRNPLPAFTQLVGGSMKCEAAQTPAGLSPCTTDATDGQLSWSWPVTDTLPAGASGEVSFEVLIE